MKVTASALFRKNMYHTTQWVSYLRGITSREAVSNLMGMDHRFNAFVGDELERLTTPSKSVAEQSKKIVDSFAN